MIFYQIYAELNVLTEKYNNIEELLVENCKVSLKNEKKEEKLYQRIGLLEEKNKELIKEFERVSITLGKTVWEVELYKEKNNELFYKHNEMVAKINTIIAELNDVITVLNNKHQENYYFYVYFVKKSLIRAFFERGIFKM